MLKSPMFWLALVGLALAGLVGCRPATNETVHPPCPPLPDDALIDADVSFGIRLLHALRQERPAEDALISPASLAMALHLVRSGAAGETSTAMAKALGTGDLDRGFIEDDAWSLLHQVDHMSGAEDDSPKMVLANSLWLRDGVDIKPAFLDTGRDRYCASVEALDFDLPSAADEMNAWVGEQTQGLLGSIVHSPIDPQAVLVVLSAAYLKQLWDVPFEEGDIHNREFRLGDERTKWILMMSRLGGVEYLDGGSFQAVRLPYTSKRLGFVALLPDEGTGIDEVLAEMTPERWREVMEGFATEYVDLWLPRFRTAFTAQLESALTELGMGVAFDQARADFSGIADGQMWIGEVQHDTVMTVHEKGTEAAAASEVQLYQGMRMARDRPKIVHIDRAFICAICDRTTGAVLFLGAIVDPGEA